MSNFQIAVLGIFSFFILVGVILFATFKGSSNATLGPVIIWGTVSDNIVNGVLDELNSNSDLLKNVKYVEINGSEFDTKLAEAMASGNGPDIFVLPQTSILKHESKILTISYDTLSLRDYKDKFIEESELYLNNSGIIALPFFVDPMVMYWNRDIFSSAGISNPPKRWEEFYVLSEKITEKDNNFNILKSAFSLGEFKNIKNAKDLLSTLIMQAGDKIVSRENDAINVSLGNKLDSSISPAEASLNFYTQFSNPSKTVYSWNRALPNSDEAFVAGDLGIYFGFASELTDLRKRNPNLNFDVAVIPQIEGKQKIVFGNMLGFAIAKSAKNPADALAVASALTDDAVLTMFSDKTNLPPVSRALLTTKPADPYKSVFYDSALISKAWLDPNPQETNLIFKEMVESIVSGKNRPSEAVSGAGSEISVLFR